MDCSTGVAVGRTDRQTNEERMRAVAPSDPSGAGGRSAVVSPTRGNAISERSGRSTAEAGPVPASGASAAEQRSLSVSLYARGSTDARTREESVFDRLRELQRAGRIGELYVRTWPGEVSLAREGRSEVVETFRAFETWADEHEASIRPPFAVRERQSTITDQTDRLLLTPLVSVAVYDAEEIVGVYPCVHGDAVTTIDDCLDQLETDAEVADEPDLQSGEARTRSDRSSTEPGDGT